MKSFTSLMLLVVLIAPLELYAQGDGPRGFLLLPKNVLAITAKWMYLHQNFAPAGNILVTDAAISVNVFPVIGFYTFGINNLFAQITMLVTPGMASGTVQTAQSSIKKTLPACRMGLSVSDWE